jgi:hypothetical protein
MCGYVFLLVVCIRIVTICNDENYIINSYTFVIKSHVLQNSLKLLWLLRTFILRRSWFSYFANRYKVNSLVFFHIRTVQHLDVIKVFFHTPTDPQVNCLKNNFKIYIKIDIKTAPTCFGAVAPSTGSELFVLAKVTVVKIAN